jgi:hypothetical protein
VSDCLLNLIVAPSIEPAVTEWLLEREDVPGFSSLPIAGHGSSEQSMTLAEQVTGRSKRVLFLIQLGQADAERLLAELGRSFAGSGLHFWMTPVLRAGHLD